MDLSKRAVASYRRCRMIDDATLDEDKVTPVYKLEEICELLRSSPVGIVKEISEFVLKRLDHKSPIVKQKALRLIKYSVGKSGAEFRREMQRHSVAVKQLLQYKGRPDPLKGDALSKAVRETAQDALSAIFSTDDKKPATDEVTCKRMEGFGNTNFVMPSDEKSFLSEVVDLGSPSIKQGLSTLIQAQPLKKNGTGSYRGSTLQRSLTNEPGYSDSTNRSVMPRNAPSGNSSSTYSESKTREERFLETIVTSGGVRLQPTRDALQTFLVEASKMDALALSHALESKFQSPHWQVRMKAICVLEEILRKKDDEHFAVIASYFEDNIDIVIKCSESPQASVREKANRVLSLLGGRQTGNASEKSIKAERTVAEMPDLIDTGDNDLLGAEDAKASQDDQHVTNNTPSTSPLIDDHFGDGTSIVLGTSAHRIDDDPFADVSFHSAEDKNKGTDLFAGMTVGENSNTSFDPDPFDIFGSSEPMQKHEEHKNDVMNLMSNLSIGENDPTMNPKGNSVGVLPESIFLDSDSKPGSQVLNSSLNNGLGTEKASTNSNAMFPMGANPYNIHPGMLFNQWYHSQPVNYGAMSALLTQPQFMAAMANFQSLDSFHSRNMASCNAAETFGGSSSPIPDIFNSNLPTQISAVTMNTSKEETKAFDFISDHLAAVRDSKRMIQS